MTKQRVVIGTRSSPLALIQTEMVRDMLARAHPSIEIVTRTYDTSGDQRQDVPVTELASDAFTDRIERALLDGEIDIAVHSYKDLPFEPTDGLTIAAVPVRADVREALVASQGRKLADLPSGSVVGTSSERRGVAVRTLRPDLVIRPIRGAVGARVQKVHSGEYDAAVLAVAGLERLGLADHITEYFDTSLMPPAAGQGALAVQCRAGDDVVRALVASIDDPALHTAVDAEREAELRQANL